LGEERMLLRSFNTCCKGFNA